MRQKLLIKILTIESSSDVHYLRLFVYLFGYQQFHPHCVARVGLETNHREGGRDVTVMHFRERGLPSSVKWNHLVKANEIINQIMLSHWLHWINQYFSHEYVKVVYLKKLIQLIIEIKEFYPIQYVLHQYALKYIYFFFLKFVMTINHFIKHSCQNVLHLRNEFAQNRTNV